MKLLLCTSSIRHNIGVKLDDEENGALIWDKSDVFSPKIGYRVIFCTSMSNLECSRSGVEKQK